MYQVKQNETLQQIQLPQIRSSPSQKLIKIDSTPKISASLSRNPKLKICIALSLIAISMIIIFSSIQRHAHPPIVVQATSPFQLFVYCPYSYLIHHKRRRQNSKQYSDLLKQQGHRYKISHAKHNFDQDQSEDQYEDQQDYNWNNTYVVEMQSNTNGSLSYCGLATYFNSTCQEYIQYKCSIPGPIFDLKVNQYVDIVWINNLNPNYYVKSQCMDSNDTRCALDSKIDPFKTTTHTDPTNHIHGSFKSIPITSKNWPTSTHVHGAEVRPTFDGNPLSWIDNQGNKGLGTFSTNDKCYFNNFENTDNNGNSFLPPEIIVKDRKNRILSTVKINRYPNIQNPGNLWYHDHAMRLTYYNVANGLSGNYILRDSKVESQIGVHKSNQRFVMMTAEGWKTETLTLMTDTVYRFRFLNNHNEWMHVYKISFVYGNTCLSDKFIPFTIIGADSSLFHEGIYNQTSFVIAQAERIQVLIILKKGFSTSYSICSVSNINLDGRRNTGRKGPASKLNGNLLNNKLTDKKNSNLNTRKSINNVTLSVPFIDFTTKSKLVAVKRMRAMIDLNGIMSMNGRATFHMGKSQNPIIGTYQDWYMINAMPVSFNHPMHVHLINFQVIKIMSLRAINGCTLYELDFIVEAILKGSKYRNNASIFLDKQDVRKVNYTALCNFKKEIYASPGFHNLLEQVNVQNIKDANNISGIDVQKTLSNYDRGLLSDLNISIPTNQNYKYITNEANPIKPYYKRWKDTALLQGHKVLVFRIRWTKTSYKDGTNDSFFNIPLDQLREYPGFVYHCHILTDQDNQMMRPIMLQLPKNTKLDSSIPCNSGNDISWRAKVKCLNEIECKKRNK